MIRLLTIGLCLSLFFQGYANVIVVKNIEELNAANRNASPGDTIMLQNGNWKNVAISLDCIGSKEKPIVFEAQTSGKVLITGNSKLKIGGQFIIVDGLHFTMGFAGKDAVITFRIDNSRLANNCRVTNTVINDFNNPKRMDENSWVLFYGKNNTLDHCSFIDKKNMGVLLAVILDDERSRENFHSIDHNYFGRRLPLGSNGGEIIRVGLAQHCQFNSNTSISHNFFENCDGEAEVISIKSCANEIEGNVFKECQGSVVLRHGDNNVVAGNYFLGNDKPGTGGVRVINKGQAIVNNIFYKCRGVDFRSPLVIMNGVPNSPPTRYVQVTNAEITGNSFYECSSLSFCEGSDAERTLPPNNVRIADNTFYNTRDSIIYRAYDDIKGIRFASNKVSNTVRQNLGSGFIKLMVPKQKKLSGKEMAAIQHPSIDNIALTESETFGNTGANWFVKNPTVNNGKIAHVNCRTAEEVYVQLEKKDELVIHLTGNEYKLAKPFTISKTVRFTRDKEDLIKIVTGNILSAFIISGKGNLILENLNLDGRELKATHFISSDNNGYSDHYNLAVTNCSFKNFNRNAGCQTIFYAFKSMIADSIVISKSSFTNNNCDFFSMKDEQENKGYYNAERIVITLNSFTSDTGILVNIYRGGTDESTMGPNLTFSHNKLKNCNGIDPLIKLTGVQIANIFSNSFNNCNPSSTLISYTDVVRARHKFAGNTLVGSGKVEKDNYVAESASIVK